MEKKEGRFFGDVVRYFGDIVFSLTTHPLEAQYIRDCLIRGVLPHKPGKANGKLPSLDLNSCVLLHCELQGFTQTSLRQGINNIKRDLRKASVAMANPITYPDDKDRMPPFPTFGQVTATSCPLTSELKVTGKYRWSFLLIVCSYMIV